MRTIFVLLSLSVLILSVLIGCNSNETTQSREAAKAIEEAQLASQQAIEAANEMTQEALNTAGQLTDDAAQMAAEAQKNMEEAKARMGTQPIGQNPPVNAGNPAANGN